MNIAIIGTGISGLTAAYYLQHQHHVELFEANDWIGGHTHTVDVQWQGKDYAIDTGFIVCNDKTYPNFLGLMDELGVMRKPTEMSFSVSVEHPDVEYNGNNLNSLFAQRSNLVNPRFLSMISDILAFNKQAKIDATSDQLNDCETLGQYLKRGGYGERFINHYIVPMGAAIWSTDSASMFQFPAKFFVRFFQHHGLLNVTDRPQWYVINGGSRSYIPALTRGFANNIHLNTPVKTVVRNENGVEIFLENGEKRSFDKVIFACHADQALRLLAQPSEQEKQVLQALPYQPNDVVLHTDPSLMPRRKKAWASWNYRMPQNDQQPVCVSYWMNLLQGIKAPTDFFVTLNQTDAIDPSKILGRWSYDHPLFTQGTTQAQANHHTISGHNHSYFCGAYWRNGFHEDGVVSALTVVDQVREQSTWQTASFAVG